MTTKKIAQSPAIPADYELADADAIQALERGDADEQQQRRALTWIVNQAAGTYQFHYYGSERDTAFALGRAWTGMQIVKLTKLNLSALRRKQDG
jgi:hypothetical protein